MTDILVDSQKFDEMNRNIFLAMDEDDSGVLQCEKVEEFVRSFLRGHQLEGLPNTDFENENTEVYKMLSENESGEVDAQEMSKFMLKLIKNQIHVLQARLEE